MVQLHYTRKDVENSLRRAKEELEDPYYNVLLEFYYDLEGDPRVNSITSLKFGIDKLRVVLRWLQERGIRPEEIDGRVLKKLLLYLKLERGLKPSSIQYYVRVLRRLLRLLGKQELVSFVPYPRKSIQPIELPPPELVEKIIFESRSLKHQVIIAMLYETGARISEILALKGKHVKETTQGYYRVIIEEPKNNEFRIVYVVKYASLLRQYLNMRKPGPNDYLFPSPKNPDKPLTPRSIDKILGTLGEKHGVKLYPHLLRHLRATQLIKEKVPERIVMKLLGHKTEQMMQRYVNLLQKDVEQYILKHYGINPETNNGKETIKCPRCGATNPGDANYCWRCGYPLHSRSTLELEKKQRSLKEKLDKLIRLLKEHPELLEKI